uniref:Uncharacterized protein n=1 Tax=Lotharella globosa TaxID=91324 RepID=A0A7S4DUA0_9EUKA|mmetsp:Transcript_13260/g.25172  ORF Transcript_13260/g.25172 Transcript_13260/m.25172 type:complete len:197 (+) Transcript_13260:68-658(+)|eukprot:CAMPEP_0167790348 /NCGR_PEP_ID=MMETSP0111_2-20121227/11259_1 /TAXON_ID=91324 /ORGANISM="Lotharella globosa, Strain CCCM811" /LENGTH=196 /DNA_ID=CAMNT_0007682753 /DNA_START=74 /DNA_END=664 /DNA_ORIENTATION=+
MTDFLVCVQHHPTTCLDYSSTSENVEKRLLGKYKALAIGTDEWETKFEETINPTSYPQVAVVFNCKKTSSAIKLMAGGSSSLSSKLALVRDVNTSPAGNILVVFLKSTRENESVDSCYKNDLTSSFENVRAYPQDVEFSHTDELVEVIENNVKSYVLERHYILKGVLKKCIGSLSRLVVDYDMCMMLSLLNEMLAL